MTRAPPRLPCPFAGRRSLRRPRPPGIKSPASGRTASISSNSKMSDSDRMSVTVLSKVGRRTNSTLDRLRHWRSLSSWISFPWWWVIAWSFSAQRPPLKRTNSRCLAFNYLVIVSCRWIGERGCRRRAHLAPLKMAEAGSWTSLKWKEELENKKGGRGYRPPVEARIIRSARISILRADRR